ncbi:hypothetical protein ACYSUO_18715 [Streptomyces sp. UC4497]
MGTTVTERFEVVLRYADTGKVITGIYGAATPEDCAKTAAVNGIATQLASWQTLDWKKAVNDALWADPTTIIEYTDDPDSSVVFEALVMKQVTTVVDESTVQSTQVEWVPAFG